MNVDKKESVDVSAPNPSGSDVTVYHRKSFYFMEFRHNFGHNSQGSDSESRIFKKLEERYNFMDVSWLPNLLKGHSIFIFSAVESEYRFPQFPPASLTCANGQPLSLLPPVLLA